MKKQTHTFTDLINIMARLRAPDGCPWDRQQSYQDIAAHTLEETHEVLDAIDKQDMGALCEELGDLLLQVVFYAQIASEEQKFTINDIINGICNKIIHRHPHVFGDEKIDNADEVLKQWEMLKKKEGKKSAVGGVPNGLPALLQHFVWVKKHLDWDLIGMMHPAYWTKYLRKPRSFTRLDKKTIPPISSMNMVIYCLRWLI